MKITLIAGARPNFIKIAPIIHAISAAVEGGAKLSYRLVHTGQHYDKKMSETFFEELNIPQPDVNLECGGGSQAEQTAAIMIAFEKELMQHPADLVIVVGDVTSTMACAIVAKKLNTKVAHVEGGIRSFDLTMPEEINRMVTDSITDYFFTTSEFANENLRKLGVKDDAIFFVGNVMIDTLKKFMPLFTPPDFYTSLNLKQGNYFVLTLHRPANVDQVDTLNGLITAILEHSGDMPIIFPIHPRTAKIFAGLSQSNPRLIIVEPLGYLQFNYLVKNAFAVITDSGGITEETTVMGIPCLTLRNNTERPETITIGTNTLVGTQTEALTRSLKELISTGGKSGAIPPLWDGKSAERIVQHLISLDEQ